MTEQELEKEIKKVYARASKEMTEKMKAYLKQFEEEIDLMSQKVEAGEITERYFNKWKRDKIMQYNQWYDTRNKITDVLMDADDVARDLIKGALPTVMADGINRTFYELEQIHEIGDMGISFKLTEENTVKRLLTEHPRLLPVLDEESETARMIREGKAIRWNQQHITSEITQGIIQGESMPKIAERMMNVTGMNYRSAIRNARTATGGAYNAGRIEGMKQAEEKGVKMLKRWSAIFDDKTRDEHRLLDGVTIPIDEKFEIDGYELEYPRDPNGEPEMIYNCRCRLVSVPALIADTYDEIFDKDGQTTQSGLTYDEWKEGKQAEQETTAETESRSSESASAALTTESEQIIDPKENAQNPSDFVSETDVPVPARFEKEIAEIDKMTDEDMSHLFIDKDSYIYQDDYKKLSDERDSLVEEEKAIKEKEDSLNKELESESRVKPREEWTEEEKEFYILLREKPTEYTDRGYEIQKELRELRTKETEVETKIEEFNERRRLKDRKEYYNELDEWESKEHPFVQGDIDKEYQGFSTEMRIGQFDEDLKTESDSSQKCHPMNISKEFRWKFFTTQKNQSLLGLQFCPNLT